ncbi:unnamed protein product [Meganyctiphanes norvegica]|uniref:Ig-like domain-containing protein n=1 Tax=Meganyctiphanes norvegica TaxID=48144 RepID=A0AAV2PZZ8_MEGNR
MRLDLRSIVEILLVLSWQIPSGSSAWGSSWTNSPPEDANELDQDYANAITPDPGSLVGEVEAELLPQDSAAYFVTLNNSQVTVQVGSTAALRCQVYDVAEHSTISWIRHRDHHLITVGTTTYSNDERFQVIHSAEAQDWTLQVRFAQPRDAGVYECQVSAHPPLGQLTTLVVMEAVADINGPIERLVQTGSPVHLVCTISQLHEPPTYVFWYHGDHMVNYDNTNRIKVTHGSARSELHISSVNSGDSGNYTCMPSNAQPASIHLQVITGETPAAMQRASATEMQRCISLALMSSLLALMAL